MPTSRSRARCATQLIATGRARHHHALPDSGWLTVPIRTVSDLGGAVEVFRISYERALRQAARGGDGQQ